MAEKKKPKSDGARKVPPERSEETIGEKTMRLPNARAPFRTDPLPFLKGQEKPKRPAGIDKTEQIRSPKAEDIDDAPAKPARRPAVQGPKPLPGMVPPR